VATVEMPAAACGSACGCGRNEGGGDWGRDARVRGRCVFFIYDRAGWAKWAIGPRASTWAASCRLFSCRAGLTLWAEVAAQPSPTSCSCRPRPEIIVLGSCSCRAKNSCFGLAHGPRAFWPSILPLPHPPCTSPPLEAATLRSSRL
jgi:hypothetical protein